MYPELILYWLTIITLWQSVMNEHAVRPDYRSIAYSYDAMGSILYYTCQQYDEALKCYKPCDITCTLEKIGAIFEKKGNAKQALAIYDICRGIKSSCPQLLESRTDNLDINALIAEIFNSD
ncbi:unnamed protein product [Rotaria socialis]|uniref:Uncharacterized protein n=1 Tax=Rotaria socialis TaxID=392032 RepID=A0A821PQR0_9BILA|nr:unnamed protein product [Rotaria socialis]CAF4809515.1 unnamed protein product [Rotaria socialis]